MSSTHHSETGRDDAPTSRVSVVAPSGATGREVDRETAIVVRRGGSPSTPALDPAVLGTSVQASVGVEASRIARAMRDMPRPGDTSHGFTIVREIGSGGFGRVFLATQETLSGRLVVLKFSPDLAVETRALAKLQHTNIVPIYSVHRSNSLQVVCMPFFGTTTLQRLLARYRDADTVPLSGKEFVDTFRHLNTNAVADPSAPEPPPVDDGADPVFGLLASTSYVRAAVWIVLRLTDGLAHAHERGIIHRDIKPANILMTDDGQPMLLDFGVAEEVAVRAVEPGATLGGTLAYMAPEHLEEVLSGEPFADRRSDIYSLGIVLYELLTGRYPFRIPASGSREDVERLLAERRAGPLASVRSLNRDVSPGLESIVATCLEFEPARRYPSAMALREDLHRHLHEQPLLTAPERSWRERIRKWARRHPRLSSFSTIAAVLIALATVAGGAAWTNWQRMRGLEAERAVRELHDRGADAKQQLLADPGRLATVAGGIAEAEALLASYGPDWERESPARHLPPDRRDAVRRELVELNLLLARGYWLRAIQKSPADEADAAAAIRANARAGELAGDDPPRMLFIQRVTMFGRLGRDADAAAAKEALAKLTPRSARDYVEAATAEFDAGRAESAIKLYRKAQSLEPNLSSAHFCEGIGQFKLGRWESARASFTACLALDPNAPFALYNRAAALLRLNDPAAALDDLTAALKQLPDFAAARTARAEAREQLQQFAEAITDLDAAIALGDTRPENLAMRARLKARLAGPGDNAGNEPTTADGWIHRGLDLLANDKAGALKAFEKAIELDPLAPNPRMYQAHVYGETGREAECVAALSKAFELDPKNVAAVASRGVMRGRLKKYPEAVADARRALDLSFAPLTVYQAACAFAHASRETPAYRAEAIALLGIALRGGFGHDFLDRDRDLEAIRSTPEFRELAEQARRDRPTAKP